MPAATPLDAANHRHGRVFRFELWKKCRLIADFPRVLSAPFFPLAAYPPACLSFILFESPRASSDRTGRWNGKPPLCCATRPYWICVILSSSPFALLIMRELVSSRARSVDAAPDSLSRKGFDRSLSAARFSAFCEIAFRLNR